MSRSRWLERPLSRLEVRSTRTVLRVHLSRLEFDGYRNLDEPVHLSHPLSVIVGENNTGKSNVIDALRMTLLPLTGWPLRPRREDFAHAGTGTPTVAELTVSAYFEELSFQQSGRMVTALDGARDRAVLHLNCALPDVGQPRARYLGGEAKSNDLEEWARTAVTYTYLPPLRDAEEDLRPGRNNRLIDLVAALTGDGPDRQKILEISANANSDLSAVKSIVDSRGRIQDRLDAISGVGHAQGAELLFSEPVFERVLSTLGISIGDGLPLAMSQNGLGLNNVLYMSVLLAALTYDHGSELHVLLVEEPEAHVHPQLQDLLMRFLQKEVDSRDDVQVIVTTHSPNFAAAARVERITSMSRFEATIVPRSIEQCGLQAEDLEHLARFLDVTKAALLFARGVILIEGLAEQLVLPLLAAELDEPKSFAELGVTLVNVGGLAFGPFAALYEEGRLPCRCAIVSDADPPKAKDVLPGEPNGADTDQASLDATSASQPLGKHESANAALSATAQKLKASENAQRHVFLSDKTFEYDLVKAGNWDWAIEALRLLKPRVAKWLSEDEGLDTPDKQAQAILDAVDGVKGRFAQALTTTLPAMKAKGFSIVVPGYLKDAIEWACKPMDAPGVVPTPPPDPQTEGTDEAVSGSVASADDGGS